jgi:hypothetical protein
MSSKTPLPRMGLRARDKDSQKHPGKPDMPRLKRPTTEVQAEKTEKAREQSKRERLHTGTIQSTAELESRMEAQLKEKLITAHSPPPTTQKKVLRVRAKTLDVSSEAEPTGMSFFQTWTRTTDDCYIPVHTDNGTRTPSSEAAPTGMSIFQIGREQLLNPSTHRHQK